MDVLPEISNLGFRDVIKKLNSKEERDISAKVWDYFFGESNGQCRTDKKWQYHDMVGVKLGYLGNPLSREGLKEIEMNEVYVGQSHLNKTYTILNGSYIHFITDALQHHLGNPCWFLPSKGLDRLTVYEGQLAAVLELLETYWNDFYEFTISAIDLSWMVDYNHHHTIIIYGNREAGRAQILCKERRKWQDRVMACDFYPRND